MDAARPAAMRQGVVWNAGALGIAAVCGLGVNGLILGIHGTEALGRFTEAMAVYVIAAQLSAFGLHLSTLKDCASHSEDREICGRIVSAALAVALAASVITVSVLVAARSLLERAFGTPGLGDSLAAAGLGVACFAANKVLLGALNGIKAMKALAVFTALRYLLILACVAAGLLADLRPALLPGALTVAEGTLLGLQIAYFHRLRIPLGVPDPHWCSRHLAYGSRAVASGLLVEANSKTDILILGLLASPVAVGVYALPQAIAEGFSQLVSVARQNIDPSLARAARMASSAVDVAWIVRLVKREFVPTLVGLGVVGVAGFPMAARWFVDDAVAQQAAICLGILVSGVVLSARWKAFGGILLQGGQPGLYSSVQVLSWLFNIACCLVLVPMFGAYGAALSVAFGTLVESLTVVALGRRLVGIRI